MHPFISLPFGKIGSFPLCIGAGLMILVLLFFTVRGAWDCPSPP